MSPHPVPAVIAAGPTIRCILREFLENRRGTLAAVDFRLYRHVIFFLEYCVNNQAYRNLGPAERTHYESLYHGSGGTTQFSEIFGPEMLVPELDDFADFYIRTEVHTSERVERKAKEVVSDLNDWLRNSGTLPSSVLEEQQQRARERRRLRRRLDRLARLVSRRLVSVEPGMMAPEDTVVPDYYLVSRLEYGRLWLLVHRMATPEQMGPLHLPPGAAESLRVGWSLHCALGRLRGRWQLIALEEIYPRG